MTKLCDLSSTDPADTVCSVSWSQRGTYLSVGTNKGDTQLWDAHKVKMIRNLGVSAGSSKGFAHVHLLMVKNPAMGGQCHRQMHLQRGQDVQELPAQGACQTTALWTCKMPMVRKLGVSRQQD